MTRENLLTECIRLRTATVMYDSRNSTSFEEEIAYLLRNHEPFSSMTEEELELEYASAKEAADEIGVK